jgi:hypothetical protein
MQTKQNKIERKEKKRKEKTRDEIRPRPPLDRFVQQEYCMYMSNQKPYSHHQHHHHHHHYHHEATLSKQTSLESFDPLE